ncbi:MAG: type I glyceraldehyde-3-phosphate dehydrogenase [Candidatus Portnoybacteria bacterium]|nr:type I glyceraldehyde-3-phosphate dehydrogenase [Candidatus Portnoybacteria bacterium]
MTKIAINGFGRIGRQVFRIINTKFPDGSTSLTTSLKIAAINDLTDAKTLAHLLKYDSNYGKYDKKIEAEEDKLIVGDKTIKILSEKEPADLPWKEMEIDVVLECTGLFTEYEDAKKHIDAGAKKVIISAPSKSLQIPTYILGVNVENYDSKKDDVISMASCTTNALTPAIKILHDNFTVLKGFMTTAHSYTNDQPILDLPHKDLRRARAAAINIIPTSTGAARTVAKAIPDLKDKLDGISWRVPTSTVSIVEFTCVVKSKTNVEQVNSVFKEAAEGNLKGILGYSEEPLVSMDYKGDTRSGIIDSALTMVKSNLVKVNIWYDNEWGYSCRLAEMAEYIAEKL